MTQSRDTEVLIIGAGFAGLSVASRLKGRAWVIDRGEPFDLPAIRADIRRRMDENVSISPTSRQPYVDAPSMLEAEIQAMNSSMAGNRVHLPISIASTNFYSYREGGISNWWGGFSPRITRETFQKDGVLSWPISYEELEPHYREAESILRVHGDPEMADRSVYGPMPGWKFWKDYMGDIFPGAHVTSEAKNISDREGAMGLCQGYGHCAICEVDAKARPATAFPNIDTFPRTLCKKLVIRENGRAEFAICEADGEVFNIHFDKVVIAAGGLENVALVNRSDQHPAVPWSNVGRRYQDHAAAEIVVRLPKEIPFANIGAECHVALPSLSGYIHGVEVETLLLTMPLRRAYMQQVCPEQANENYDRHIGSLYAQLEIPPEWDLRVKSSGHEAYLYAPSYAQNVPIYHRVMIELLQRLRDSGVEPLAVIPHYQHSFGGHHYSGTTPMSKGDGAVVDTDQRLIGTENVYINGASVLPRCGGCGPTLTLTATGLRLGDHLAKMSRG